MKQYQTVFAVQTEGGHFTNITNAVQNAVRQSGITTGLMTLFIKHTSAALTVQENADPDVLYDLKNFFDRTVPQDNSLYVHTYEGKDDMSAHIRSTLTGVSLNIPVSNGKATLGTWQAVYVCEFRNHPNIRNVVCHIIGEE